MEEYKDVMLSEPPSRFTAAPAVHTATLDNYKGILLCDRPANARTTTQSGLQPFLPAGRSDERYVGMQPSVEERARIELCRNARQSSKVTKPTAVTRHKRWLKSFATAVKQMQLDKAEKQLEEVTKLDRLREEQAELRRVRKEAPHSVDTSKQQQEESTPTPTPTPSQLRSADQQRLPSLTSPAASQRQTKKMEGKKSKSTKKKPLWAMTEDEALDAEVNEHNALLDFTASLNYEKFIEDYEVREALSIMRDRVKEIAAEQGIRLEEAVRTENDGGSERSGEGDDAASEAPSQASTVTREVRRQRLAEKAAVAADAAPATSATAAKHDADWNSSTKVSERMRAALNDEAVALAEKILCANEAMRQVYTKQSLAKMLHDVTLGHEIRSSVAKTRATGAAQLTGLPPMAPPVVSVVSAESQPQQGQCAKRVLNELRHSKSHVQNLPYMYRCPSL